MHNFRRVFRTFANVCGAAIRAVPGRVRRTRLLQNAAEFDLLGFLCRFRTDAREGRCLHCLSRQRLRLVREPRRVGSSWVFCKNAHFGCRSSAAPPVAARLGLEASGWELVLTPQDEGFRALSREPCAAAAAPSPASGVLAWAALPPEPGGMVGSLAGPRSASCPLSLMLLPESSISVRRSSQRTSFGFIDFFCFSDFSLVGL